MRRAPSSPPLGITPLALLLFPRTGSRQLEVGTGVLMLSALAIGNDLCASDIDVPDVASLQGSQVGLPAAVGPTDAPLGIDHCAGVIVTLGR